MFLSLPASSVATTDGFRYYAVSMPQNPGQVNFPRRVLSAIRLGCRRKRASHTGHHNSFQTRCHGPTQEPIARSGGSVL